MKINSIHKALDLTNHYAFYCSACPKDEGVCFVNHRISTCLNSEKKVGKYCGETYVVNEKYNKRDIRRYDFERDFTNDELAEILRCNA